MPAAAPSSLRDALKGRVLLLDGANGTRLEELGYPHHPYDRACLEAPDLVERVHREYVEAGADAIETNTFSTNRFRLDGDDPAPLARAAAHLARRAVAGTPVFVLGAIGPCGKPMEPIGSISREDARASFLELARALDDGGVDGFLLETFVDLCELELAVQAVREISDKPVFASKAYIEDGEMLAEGLPARCTDEMESWGVDALGANCVVGPQRMLDLVRSMGEETELPVLAMPTPGLPQIVKGHIAYDGSPEYFAHACARLVEEGATIVGGCCGTTPAHIAALRARLDAGIKRKARRVVAHRTATVEKELVAAEPSELALKLGRKFVAAVEMDVPRGLNLEKLLHGARTLKIAGADVINIADGARARLRMDPASVASLIQSRVGIETTMHFSCRDRNLLAIQSDLLGCHATGVRNILAVTGDPTTIGDYPSATSVFDVDAIGLCRILRRFNEGIDLAGYSVGIRCAFTIACAYNPNAIDQTMEDDRLRRKADAGAQVIYTQPVFDERSMDRALRIGADLTLPVLVGIMPLRSARHAEFMHNEVPGVDVPEGLLAALAAAEDDAAALEIGMAEAHRMTEIVKARAQGLYLMPPGGSAAIAARLLAG